MSGEIKKAGADFAKNELRPHWDRLDAEDAAPLNDILDAAAANGVFSFVLDEELGGSGFPVAEYAVFVEEISRACAGIGCLFATHLAGMTPLILAGDRERANRFLREAPEAEQRGKPCVFALAVGETPQAAPNADDVATALREEDGAFILSGAKYSVMGAGAAAYLTALARRGDGSLAWVVVPADAPGVKIGARKRLSGLRICPVNDVALDGVKVPAENVFPVEGGDAGVTRCYEFFDAPLGAVALGAAMEARDTALKYSLQRYQGGAMICEHDAVRLPLADMDVSIRAAGALLAAGGLAGPALAAQTAETVCLNAIQTLGGYGYMSDYRVERMLRDVKTLQAFINPRARKTILIKRAIEGAG